MLKVVKSLIYIVLSSLSIYFLGGIIPKIIDMIDSGYEQTFCIIFYWIGLLSIIVVPQYWVWFSDEDIDIIAPIKSLGVFAISIFAVVIVSLVTDNILNVITLSNTSGMIYAVCFWLFAFFVMFVPQIFVYEPLRTRLT